MNGLNLMEKLDIYERDFSQKEYVKHLNELAYVMLPTVAPFLEVDPDELKARFINIVDFRMPPLNGSPETWDRWDTFQININLRFQMFLLQVIPILCSRLIIYEDGSYSVDYDKSDDDLNEFILDKISDYWRGKYEIDDFFTPGNLSKKKREAAKCLMLIADLFTIAHNFGHVVLRKSTKSTVEMKFGRQYVNDVFKKRKRPIKSEGKLGRDLVGFWTNEITSDIFGFLITSEFIDDLSKLQMFLMPGFSLLIFCLELILTRERKLSYVLNHVSPAHRFAAVFSFCRHDRFELTTDLSEEFYMLVRKILKETKLKAYY